QQGRRQGAQLKDPVSVTVAEKAQRHQHRGVKRQSGVRQGAGRIPQARLRANNGTGIIQLARTRQLGRAVKAHEIVVAVKDIREGREFHETVHRDPEQTAEDDEKALEPRRKLGGTWRIGRGDAQDFRRQHTHGYRPICVDSGTLQKRQLSVLKICRYGNRLHLVLKRRYPIVNAPSPALMVRQRKEPDALPTKTDGRSEESARRPGSRKSRSLRRTKALEFLTPIRRFDVGKGCRLGVYPLVPPDKVGW